mmetsp:Transcript_1194/g.1296  ORF Transcript_1194/g.1296 Transcript_1194/m.1296 type:complete len:280 (-) Transcript_1194:169-1008(-)
MDESDSTVALSKLANEHDLTEVVSIPNFLRKTYEILQSNEFGDLICWSEDGRAVVIKQPAEFALQVLPKYFKHSNLSSYIRQLNMYNFRKKKTSNLECFVHDCFQKDRKDLLAKIKRKKSESTLPTATQQLSKKGHPSMKPANSFENDRLMEENKLLKKFQADLAQRFYETERKVVDLSNQNQMLSNHLQNVMLRVSLQAKGSLGAYQEQMPHKIEYDPTLSFQGSTSPQMPSVLYHPVNMDNNLRLQGINLSWAIQMPQTNNSILPTVLSTTPNLSGH